MLNMTHYYLLKMVYALSVRGHRKRELWLLTTIIRRAKFAASYAIGAIGSLLSLEILSESSKRLSNIFNAVHEACSECCLR